MAEHEGERETLIEKIAEKIHGHDSSSSSSSSDSDDDNSKIFESAKSKIFRLFGREKPVHHVLGGGKSADVLLWRNKKISAGVLSGVTVLWFLFEVLQYHLVTLVCHILILSLGTLFLWSNACTVVNKSTPSIPELKIPEHCFIEVVSALRIEINRALAVLRDMASGRDLKEFLGVVAGLWFLSLVGRSCNFLTFFYIAFLLLHTVPVLYEKYEDHVDLFAEKATVEIKKQYVVFDAKVLSKIPRGSLKKD